MLFVKDQIKYDTNPPNYGLPFKFDCGRISFPACFRFRLQEYFDVASCANEIGEALHYNLVVTVTARLIGCDLRPTFPSDLCSGPIKLIA